jgi:hypothetical protein
VRAFLLLLDSSGRSRLAFHEVLMAVGDTVRTQLG